jgi:hypothetical protein
MTHSPARTLQERIKELKAQTVGYGMRFPTEEVYQHTVRQVAQFFRQPVEPFLAEGAAGFDSYQVRILISLFGISGDEASGVRNMAKWETHHKYTNVTWASALSETDPRDIRFIANIHVAAINSAYKQSKPLPVLTPPPIEAAMGKPLQKDRIQIPVPKVEPAKITVKEKPKKLELKRPDIGACVPGLIKIIADHIDSNTGSGKRFEDNAMLDRLIAKAAYIYEQPRDVLAAKGRQCFTHNQAKVMAAILGLDETAQEKFCEQAHQDTTTFMPRLKWDPIVPLDYDEMIVEIDDMLAEIKNPPKPKEPAPEQSTKNPENGQTPHNSEAQKFSDMIRDGQRSQREWGRHNKR